MKLFAYSQVPNKRIDTLIFSKQIRLLGPVLTPIRAVLTSIFAWNKLLEINVSIHLLET